jgi:periplasmic protein TonB
MTSFEILKADVLDILFEHRNKAYGAYALRKHYNQRLAFSLGLAMSTILLLFLFNGIEKEKDASGFATRDVNLKSLTPEIKQPELPRPKLPSAAPMAQKKFVDQFHITNKDIQQDIPDLSDLGHFVPGEADAAGETGAVQSAGAGNSGGTEPPAATPPLKEAPLQREPEFPGGMQAWVNFLNRNLRVPDDLEAGEKKTVLIRFLVDIDGSVNGFEVVQSGGRAYDQEVIRVLKKMPKWKPAIQNNLPVVRNFTQPVTFMGVDE